MRKSIFQMLLKLFCLELLSLKSNNSVMKITPKLSFVIKGKLQTRYLSHGAGTKIFINVLTDPVIPKPETSFDPLVTFPMIMNNEWEIPIYIPSSELKTVLDKKQVASLYLNCIINEECMRWCILNKDLLTILIEWCVESIEFQFEDGLVIDRDTLATPKLSYKGSWDDVVDLEVEIEEFKPVQKPTKVEKLDFTNDEMDTEELISVDQLLGRSNGARKPLIEVIEEPVKIRKLGLTDVDKPKLDITVTILNLRPEQTVQQCQKLIKFSSKSDDYDLKVDHVANEIHLTTNDSSYSKTKSLIKLPIPKNNGLKCFMNKKEHTLYVYLN